MVFYIYDKKIPFILIWPPGKKIKSSLSCYRHHHGCTISPVIVSVVVVHSSWQTPMTVLMYFNDLSDLHFTARSIAVFCSMSLAIQSDLWSRYRTMSML